MGQYNALNIAWNALRGHKNWQRAWRDPEPKSNYDVIIIGGGGHGLATAYYLAKNHGITNVAVLEKGWIGGGNVGRNTTIVRSNYLLDGNAPFYEHGMNLWREMAQDLNYNVMFSPRGVMNIAHSKSQYDTFARRANTMRLNGIQSELLSREEVLAREPIIDGSADTRFPVWGGILQPDAGNARHDAVAWGYAKGATQRGVELHQLTEVLDVIVENNKVVGVKTNKGIVKCGSAVQAVAGHSSLLAAKAGFKLPIVSYPLQAMVTQPVKPFLDQMVSSSALHCYVQQTSRGEIVFGGGSDPYPLYNSRSTLELKESLLSSAIEMFPFMANLRLLRQWGGVTDMTSDYSPIMGLSPVDNYYMDAGWGTWGFKATPICGKTMADLIASGGKVPELIKPFAMDRFKEFRQVNEMGATAASH
jgi:sarcosine oxidase subunit beta